MVYDVYTVARYYSCCTEITLHARPLSMLIGYKPRVLDDEPTIGGTVDAE